MSDYSAELSRARSLLQGGDFAGAERICRRLHEAGADHPFVLSFLASRALEAGDWARAIPLSRLAARRHPDDATLAQNLGIACRRAGNHQDAAQSFRDAIAIQPDNGIFFLHLAETLLAAGRERAADRCFERAFMLNPRLRDEDGAAGPLGGLIDLAQRRLRQRFRRDIEAAANEVDPAGERLPPRFWEFLEYACGRRPIDYADDRQRPSYQYYPGLKTAPWWDPARFDWVSRLEARHTDILAELERVLARSSGLAPYVTEIHPGSSAEWHKLSHSNAWSSYHLLKGGERVEAHCRACPATAAALEDLPLARAQGHAPEAFFSVLKPGTYIPPHHGLANTKLVVHLPLIVPPGCAIKVGGETRQWQAGRCLVFDDSFEHEAWNRSDRLRVVLITEIWNPSLSAAEQAALAASIKREDDWHRTCRSFDPS